MSEIAPSVVAERRERSDDLLLVDVRDEDAFEDWHIPGSWNVPVIDWLRTDPEAAKDELSALPAEPTAVTVCAVGKTSAVATDLLQEMGYDAKTLQDGMAGWSRVHRTAEIPLGFDGTLVQVARPGTGCLSYVLVSDGEAAVFDPSIHLGVYNEILAEHAVDLVGVFDTHAHADHVSGGPRLADSQDVPYHLHPADAGARDVTPLADADVFSVGNAEVEVLHTPGHSPGSVSFGLEGGVLLTGDTVFHESVGRVELGVEAGLEETDVEANATRLFESLQRLRDYSDDPIVLPTHDPGSPEPPVSARLSDLAERNDGLRQEREAFVEALSSDVPDHPPNFERIKRVNVGVETVDQTELADLEHGPNNCAAE